MTLPINDPYAVVVTTQNELIKIHEETPELEVSFLPKYSDVSVFEQQIIELLAGNNIKDFSFHLTFKKETKLPYYCEMNGHDCDLKTWKRKGYRFLQEAISLSRYKALKFMNWLEIELKTYALLTVTKKRGKGCATFTSNRQNLTQYPTADIFHVDRDDYSGVKNYVGFGVIYAKRQAVIIKDNANYPDVDKRFSLYQLLTQGVSLHKGGNPYGTCSVHKNAITKRSKKARILTFFGAL